MRWEAGLERRVAWFLRPLDAYDPAPPHDHAESKGQRLALAAALTRLASPAAKRAEPGASRQFPPRRDKQLIRSIKRLVLAGVAAATLTAVAFAGPASASVSIDPVTGAGFVGKGDVQTVLGLNNAQMQATLVSFTMKSTTTQSFD